MTRVDYLITSLAYGGAERLVVDLARGMTGRGYRVRVISLCAPTAYVDELRESGIEFFSLNMKTKWNVFQALFRLIRFVKKDPPHILHAHMFHAIIVGRLVSKFLGYISISSIHSMYEKGWIRPFLYKVTAGFSHFTSNVSRNAVARYVRIGAARRDAIECVYNGIDPAKFAIGRKVISKKGFRWIAIGRLEFQKDYPTLLKAMSLIQDQYDLSLLILGEGGKREQIERLIEQYNLSGRVSLVGVSTDVPGFLAENDAFVLSSKWEGFGLVVAEAMAAGLPVVVTDSGGPAEIVSDSGAGFVVPAMNPEALANAMMAVMDMTDAQRHVMGEIGRKRIAEKFSLDAMLSRWDSIYSNLLRQAI